MTIQLNYKNVLAAVICLFFIYLSLLLFGPSGQQSFIAQLPDQLTVDFKDLAVYIILAAECGGKAVKMIHNEKRLKMRKKGETKEGAAEFVTRADLISNKIITDLLTKFPGLTMISEEKDNSITSREALPYKCDKFEMFKSRAEAFDQLKPRPLVLQDLTVIGRSILVDLQVWIDPLDATKEFTEDLTQYVTVMICVASAGRPIFGAIYSPFTGDMTIGDVTTQTVHSSTWSSKQSPPNRTVVVSRSHAGGVQKLVDDVFHDRDMTVEPAGGAGYKSMRVLNGTALMYVHETAIKKWYVHHPDDLTLTLKIRDVCASDAIIRAAGGHMLTLSGNEITYNADDNVKNEDGLLVALETPFVYLNTIKAYREKQEKEN